MMLTVRLIVNIRCVCSVFFFFKQKTAYEMRTSDWSSDVCSSDLGNKLIAGTKFENMSIEDIIKKSSGKIFNNAAQVWNHSFFWNCLTPKQGAPGKKLTDALVKQFGGVEDFKKQFTDTAVGTRSDEHTSDLQSLMRISYAVFCLKQQKQNTT